MDVMSHIVSCVSRGEIPIDADGYHDPDEAPDGIPHPKFYCHQRGMWAIVDLTWTRKLADWIGNRKALEVMAGAGWLAKALRIHGVDIVATDNYSWDCDYHPRMVRVTEVLKMDGEEAVNTYKEADVLIMSWPPQTMDAYRIAEAWGTKRPIVYIGEERGGCTAEDTFHRHFKPEKTIFIPRWRGNSDYLQIGHWRKNGSSD